MHDVINYHALCSCVVNTKAHSYKQNIDTADTQNVQICLQINIRSQIFPSSNVATQNSCTCIQLLYYIDLSASCCCCRLDRREYTLSSHVNDTCTYLFLMQSKTTLVVCLVVCFNLLSKAHGLKIYNSQNKNNFYTTTMRDPLYMFIFLESS